MKKKISMLCAATIAACAVSIPISASAEDNVIYGTMNIPYADFYRAELAGSTNVYEVDAVSSATTSKWSMNGEGKLFEGTYNKANADGTGTILGVTYPIAITQADLNALGTDNYGFQKLDAKPEAYKSVSVSGGKAVFSAVNDTKPVTFKADVILSTNTPWGDYLLDFKTAPDDMGAIYGAVVKTANGNSYAMRHEQNIWRGELAWSSGIVTTEPHGNALNYENYKSLMGETIKEVDFITLGGYYTVAADVYVPVKFAGSEVTVADSAAGTGTTTLKTTGFPTDYAKSYSVASGFSTTDSSISYTDAMPGNYTLTISDSNGKYADVTKTFTLTSDKLPAVYSNGKIVKAESASEAEFENFIKNISKVNVNGTDYSASGKGAVKIVAADGTIDTSVKSKETEVFSGKTNSVTVTATGYTQPLSFEVKAQPSDTANPATGASAALPAIVLGAAAILAFVSRKDNK